MGHRDELRVPAAAKGWGGPSSWRDVEELLPAALAQVAVRTPAGAGLGVTLAYVPYSGLGERAGVDLSWEVNVLRRGEVVWYGNAGHPAAAVQELLDALAEDGTARPAGGHLPQVPLERGWAPLLREVARLCCHVPDEDTGLELTVQWEPDEQVGGAEAAGAGRWHWTVEIPVPGIEYPASRWRAAGPVEVLATVLAEGDSWLDGEPAGHHAL